MLDTISASHSGRDQERGDDILDWRMHTSVASFRQECRLNKKQDDTTHILEHYIGLRCDIYKPVPLKQNFQTLSEAGTAILCTPPWKTARLYLCWHHRSSVINKYLRRSRTKASLAGFSLIVWRATAKRAVHIPARILFGRNNAYLHLDFFKWSESHSVLCCPSNLQRMLQSKPFCLSRLENSLFLMIICIVCCVHQPCLKSFVVVCMLTGFLPSSM